MYHADERFIREVQKRDFLRADKYIDRNLGDSHVLWGKRKYDVELTIVIPTYNRTNTLKKAILSALTQKEIMNFEVLIIDNNPDHLKKSPILPLFEELGDPRLVYYCNSKNLGPMGNWNRGYQLAAGKWVCMLHDDDFLHPEWLGEMYAALLKIGDCCDVLTCSLESINNVRIEENFMERKTGSGKVIKRTIIDMFKEFCAPVLGSMIRKEFFLKLGGFYSNVDFMTPFEDYIFMSKVSFYGQLYTLNQKLYGYVVSNSNDSNCPGIYDVIIIGEFYFRNSIIKNMDGKEPEINIKYCQQKTIRSLSQHGLTQSGLGNFSMAPVNKKLVISTCKIPKIKFCILHSLLVFNLYLRYYLKKIINIC